MTKRISYIDNTRAILIALVVLGHILNYANPKYDIVPYVLVSEFLCFSILDMYINNATNTIIVSINPLFIFFKTFILSSFYPFFIANISSSCFKFGPKNS